MNYGSPLIGFFHDKRFIAITIGIIDYEVLDQALVVNDKHIKVFTPYGVRSLSDASIKLENFFLVQEGN
jgi:hypothetical protein